MARMLWRMTSGPQRSLLRRTGRTVSLYLWHVVTQGSRAPSPRLDAISGLCSRWHFSERIRTRAVLLFGWMARCYTRVVTNSSIRIGHTYRFMRCNHLSVIVTAERWLLLLRCSHYNWALTFLSTNESTWGILRPRSEDVSGRLAKNFGLRKVNTRLKNPPKRESRTSMNDTLHLRIDQNNIDSVFLLW